MPSDTKCRACHAKPPKQTSRSDSAKYSHSQEISAEHFWLMCLLYCVCHAECIFAEPIRDSSKVPRRQRFWSCYKTLTFCSLLARCRIPCACHEKRFNVQNWSVHVVLLLFWLRHDSTCALRHSGVHFFNIPTSKRAPTLRRILTSKFALCHNGVHFFNNSTSKSWGRQFFALFHFDMFFATTACIFQHLNFQKCSEPDSFSPQRRAIFHLSSGQMAPHPPL